MAPELYEWLADGRKDFLRDHSRFADDLIMAINKLEIRLDKEA